MYRTIGKSIATATTATTGTATATATTATTATTTTTTTTTTATTATTTSTTSTGTERGARGRARYFRSTGAMTRAASRKLAACSRQPTSMTDRGNFIGGYLAP